MALLTAGVPNSHFQIDAVDVSHSAIDVARRSDYSRNSFRGASLEFRSRYFEETPTGHRLNREVSETVRFEVGNILDPELRFDQGRYDIIFCRNLLIYLTVSARATTFGNISKWLAEDGLLFTSVAELPLALEESFSPISEVGIGALQRGSRLSNSLFPRAGSLTQYDSQRNPPSSGDVPIVLPKADTVTSTASIGYATEALQRAKKFADCDDLDAAELACEDYFRLAGPSADGYYVKALITSARGARESISGFLERALYLDPNHAESLVFLATDCELRGDLDRAKVLRSRISRIEAG